MNRHDHRPHDSDNAGIKEKNLLLSTVLNFTITIAEVIGGLLSNSLALLSDALHNLGDTFALFIAYIAHLVSQHRYSTKRTFGYKRIEILAALFNAVVLTVIIIYLFVEAYQRLRDPQPIKGLIMFVVAVAGFLANLISVFLLREHKNHNLNIRSAYLHLFGDTVSSILVIITAVLIYFFGLYWIDPLVTFMLGIYLLKETYQIIREAVDILMQSTPQGLDLKKLKKALEEIPEIDNIHHIHAWNLNDQEIHFECHVDLIHDLKISETEKIRKQIDDILLNHFGIIHVTIQFGYHCCDDKSMIYYS
ncbi:MAG: cation transporter [Bacteroidales bacterium]|nr:cation transporter [Bacteroidales bacterium]